MQKSDYLVGIAICEGIAPTDAPCSGTAAFDFGIRMVKVVPDRKSVV